MRGTRATSLESKARGWWSGRPLVLRLYHETILSVLGGATTLNFIFAGWQPRDGVNFARVLMPQSLTQAIGLGLEVSGVGGLNWQSEWPLLWACWGF